MAVYPTDPPVKITRFAKIQDLGVNLSRLEIGSHSGTHVDAPLHCIPSGTGVDELDLSKCHGEAILLPIEKGKGEILAAKDLQPFEHSIKLARRIVVKTGWFKRWGTRGYFEDFPVLNHEGASWLLERGLDLYGADTPGAADAGGHEALLRAKVVVVEALNLAGLDSSRFIIIALPLKVAGADGSPTRCVAIVEK
jgi:arylformamidase